MTASRRPARIIPACAGSTSESARPARHTRDHPRMRGEHRIAVTMNWRELGSSPHARGARRLRLKLCDARGIIPACAGSTFILAMMQHAAGDHPRMRGEHDSSLPPNTSNQGSSPHARGARGPHRAAHGSAGIIPACAGSTPTRACRLWSERDHPRMRGEHHRSTHSRIAVPGSSPHARGAQASALQRELERGIIPACAGSTAPTETAGRPTWDHPRMRGEHEDSIELRLCVEG